MHEESVDVDEASMSEDASVNEDESEEESSNEDSIGENSEVETHKSAGSSFSDVIYSRDGNIAWSTLNRRVRRTPVRNIVRHRVGPSVNNPVNVQNPFCCSFQTRIFKKIVDFPAKLD